MIGISQNTVNDSLGVHHRRRVNNKQIIEDQEKEQRQDEKEKLIHPSLHKRAISTLDAIRNRAWKEMLARSRFNKVDECEILLAKLASEGHPHLHAFYEWINPITDQASGAYPFRTGITAIRIAIADILEKINSESASHTFKQ